MQCTGRVVTVADSESGHPSVPFVRNMNDCALASVGSDEQDERPRNRSGRAEHSDPNRLPDPIVERHNLEPPQMLACKPCVQCTFVAPTGPFRTRAESCTCGSEQDRLNCVVQELASRPTSYHWEPARHGDHGPALETPEATFATRERCRRPRYGIRGRMGTERACDTGRDCSAVALSRLNDDHRTRRSSHVLERAVR